MKSLFLSTIILVLSIVHSSFAGNEGRGTEDVVLLGRAIMDRLNTEGKKNFNIRKNLIVKDFASGKLQDWVVKFFKQVPAENLLPSKPEGFDHRALYRELQNRGAAEALAKSVIRLSDKCVDSNNEPRTATTNQIPGSEICINPERIALLELALQEKIYKLYILGMQAEATIEEGYITTFQIPFAILMHEVARQFGEDDDHRLLLAMKDEAYRHYIIYKNSPSRQFAFGAPILSLTSILMRIRTQSKRR